MTRTWHEGVDGLLHGALTVDGTTETYCATPIAPTAEQVPAGERTPHAHCMLVELVALTSAR